MKVVQDMRALISASGNVYRQERKIRHEQLLQSEGLKNGIERVVNLRRRFRARSRAHQKNKIRVAALASVRKTLESAANINAKNIKTVFNVSLYLLLLDQDLAYFTTDLVCAIGDRRRAFVTKHEATLLYEAAEDVRQLLARELRPAIKALNAPQEIIDRINIIASDLNKFWDEHREFLKTIRNTLAAHREHDSLLYVENLESLEPLEVMTRAVEFSAMLELLVQELMKIIKITSSPGGILNDMLRSSMRGEG